MGGWAQAILQQGGRSGNELQEAIEGNQTRKMQMQQFQAGLAELQKRLQGMGIEQKRQSAPEIVYTYRAPGGKVVNLLRDPLTGKITPQEVTGPPQLSKEQQLLTDTEEALGEKLTPEQRSVKLGLMPKPSGAADKVLGGTGDTRPYGMQVNGKPVLPGQPGWKPEYDPVLKAAQESFDKGQGLKTKRLQMMTASRYEAYAKARKESTVLSVYDKETGAPEMVTVGQAISAPGRYAATTVGMKQRNAAAIYNEIDASRALLNQAIAALPDGPFDATTRAQLALVLRDPNPKSALSVFLQSEGSKWLEDKPEFVDYVTTLANLQESSMSLRTLGGAGAGSDMLRRAIERMLPSGGIPSKAWAQKQMPLFETQVNALRTALLNMTPPSGGPPPGSTPSGPGKKTKLTVNEAVMYLQRAGQDRAKAEAMAKADGKEF